jgi:spore coat polysaccharide biosynthesis predicted glycosyltransferase SpsG
MERCLALAAHFDAPVTFFTDPGGGWDARLGQAGHGRTVEVDAQSAAACLAARQAGVITALLFDGYDFSRALIAQAAGGGLCVEVDDLFVVPRAQVVVNPGLANPPKGYANGAAEVLCGPHYALLRPGFAEAHGAAEGSQVAARVERVLVAMGARDEGNLTGRALDALRALRPAPAVAVVLGGAAPHLGAVRAVAQSLPDCRVLVDHADMAGLYARSDLAIGGAGISLVERLCCGVPSIAFALADNQRANLAAALAAGAVVDAGAPGEATTEGLAERLAALAGDPERRQAQRRAGLALVDGRGASRVATALARVAQRFGVDQVSVELPAGR